MNQGVLVMENQSVKRWMIRILFGMPQIMPTKYVLSGLVNATFRCQLQWWRIRAWRVKWLNDRDTLQHATYYSLIEERKTLNAMDMYFPTCSGLYSLNVLFQFSKYFFWSSAYSIWPIRIDVWFGLTLRIVFMKYHSLFPCQGVLSLSSPIIKIQSISSSSTKDLLCESTNTKHSPLCNA